MNKYLLDNDEYYEYSDEDRKLLSILELKEDDLGRYRGVDLLIHPVLNKQFIVVETRDGYLSRSEWYGEDAWHWSTAMLNHPKFSHLSLSMDMSYLDYWFFADMA